jgi:protein required for attachment to host cells
MKPIVTLYLLVSDENYRLIHTHKADLIEITHTKADLTAAGVAHVGGSSPKEGAERAHLAKHAAKILTAEWSRGIYDRIVIAAGPKMLGEIRHDLPKALHDHIAAELHKDLVKVPLQNLLSHFAGTVPAV